MASAGIHHITAICSDARRNVAFYTHALGLRMVKRTVNFDDPGTWHLYYGDETGAPGTALTFFAWGNLPPGHDGTGMTNATGFVIPERSLAYWTQRLTDKGIAHETAEQRFGATVLPFRDPDGMRLELVATPGARSMPAWAAEVPAEHAIRGFAGVTLLVREAAPTAEVLTGAFGLSEKGQEGDRLRFVAPGPLGANVDIRALPGAPAAQMGAGSVHHVAFRASDDGAQAKMAAALRAQGLKPTEQIDRQYFRSVYCREFSGILFEVATDDPGFTIDEPKETLGSAIKLPPWFEPRRAEIVAALPPID